MKEQLYTIPVTDAFESNCECPLCKMKKELDLKGNFADLGLGWLAREDKVEISKKGTSVIIPDESS